MLTPLSLHRDYLEDSKNDKQICLSHILSLENNSLKGRWTQKVSIHKSHLTKISCLIQGNKMCDYCGEKNFKTAAWDMKLCLNLTNIQMKRKWGRIRPIKCGLFVVKKIMKSNFLIFNLRWIKKSWLKGPQKWKLNCMKLRSRKKVQSISGKSSFAK